MKDRLINSKDFGKVFDFFIKEEGLKLKPYPDGVGFSVGIGHFIQENEKFLMQGITKEQAIEIFKKDLENVENTIDNTVNVPLTFNQRLAIASLIFNIGSGAWKTSTVRRELNKGDFNKASLAFSMWNKSRNAQEVRSVNPVLVARRLRESQLFRAG